MKTIFYKKNGRRYEPVSEYDSDLMGAFPKGAHLVVSHPGGRSTRFNVDPAFAPLLAAARYAEQDMANALVRGSEGKPQKIPLTKKQIAAWEQMKEAFGDDLFHIQFPSAHDSIQAGINAMQKEAETMLNNPAVKKAYNNFMLIWQLTKEHTNA